MNYLAHFHLSAGSAETLVGSFLGDFVKGPLSAGRFPPRVQAAIALHRQVDAFVDAHPAVVRSRARFAPGFRRYAGVLLDLFYDHFLARDWQTHGDEPLARFTDRAYRALDRHRALLPPGARRVSRAMTCQDWLGGYAHPDGVRRALRGISTRLSRVNPLARGHVELAREYRALEADFRQLMPELRDFVQRRVREG
ncbi:MAG: ACP phosphodiesterase [Gammaproteobacteria bacterium]|nr:ACP phosphodiesterase [Gammaproteobacteria bacterium]